MIFLIFSDLINFGKELFGKLGANAGAYAENMRLVSEAQKDQFANLTDLQKAVTKLGQAKEELAIAKDKALKSDAIISFQENIDILWVKVKTVWYNIVEAFTDIVKWLDNVTGGSDVLKEAWHAVVDYAKALWGAIQNLVGIFKDLFNALGLNNSETLSYTKNILKSLNPLNLLKTALSAVTSVLKILSSKIQESRINITAFAITAKSVFVQLADAAKSFINLDFEGGLNKLKNINISREFTNARKEAERVVALINKDRSTETETAKKKETKGTYKDQTAGEARKKAEAKKIADAKKAADEAKKALEEEAKRELEIVKTRAEQSAEIAKSELANYIAVNAEKLKSDKTLNKSKLQAQLDYYDEVRKLQQQANREEAAAKVLSVQQKIDEINKKKELGKQFSRNDIDEINNLKTKIENIHREFYNKEIQLNNETNAKKLEANKNYESQLQEQRQLSQAIEFQQRILDLEFQNASEFEIQKEHENQRFQNKLAQWAKENQIKLDLDEDNYISKTEIDITRKKLEAEIKAADDINEQQRLQNHLNTLNNIQAENAVKSKQITKDVDEFKVQSRAQVFSSLVGIFGKESALGKALAVAEITNNTVTQATKAFQQGAVFASNPFTAALAVNSYIQGGLIIATGVSQLAKLVTPKKEGYYDGGYTGDGGKYEPAGIVHKGEVVWSQQDVAAVGGASIANALRPTVKNGYYNGGIVGSSNLATVQKSISENTIDYNMLADVIGEKVLEGSALGSSAGSQKGFENLIQHRKIANGANH